MFSFCGKLFFSFAVLFCIAQLPGSQATTIETWMVKIKDECFSKYYSRKASIEEMLQKNARDITKKHASLVQRSLKVLGETDCVDIAKQTHLKDLNEYAVNAVACLDEVADNFEPSFESGALSVKEALRTRDTLVTRLNDCKNRGKRFMKNVSVSFGINGKRCLL